MKGDWSVRQEKWMLKTRRHDSASPPDKMQRNADNFTTALLPLRAKSQNRCDSTLHTSCAPNKKKYLRFIAFFSLFLFQVFTVLTLTSIAFLVVAQFDIQKKHSTVCLAFISLTYLLSVAIKMCLSLAINVNCVEKERKIMQINSTQIHIFMAALKGNRRHCCHCSCERILFCKNFQPWQKNKWKENWSQCE